MTHTKTTPKSLMRPRPQMARVDAALLSAARHNLKRETARRINAEIALKKNTIHHKKLLAQSRILQEQLRHLSRQVLQAQEEERKRISRELHDEITQILTGIKIRLEALTRENSFNSQGIKKNIADTQRMVDESVKIVYRFAKELRPALLDDLGLIPALHSFMKGITKRTGIRIRFTTFAAVDNLNILRKTTLFRVAQSALNNVCQHAGAGLAEVSISKLADRVIMEIRDNGKSFDADKILFARRPRRLGLISMRERVEMVGGRFGVVSSPGKGTVIHVSIPFRNAAVAT